MPPTGSSSDPTFSRVVAVAAVTFVLALAFGADLTLGGEPEPETGWNAVRSRDTDDAGGGWLPWARSRSQRRGQQSLNEARLRLTEERKRRVEAERSLSLARTRLNEARSERDGLRAQIVELQGAATARSQEIFQLRVQLARAAVASPELVDQFLALADDALREARFETALELASDAEAMIAALESEEGLARRARLEFIRATAQVALDDEERAADSLARLLDVAPDLEIDTADSSPKLVRVLDRVRAAREAGAPEEPEPPATDLATDLATEPVQDES